MTPQFPKYSIFTHIYLSSDGSKFAHDDGGNDYDSAFGSFHEQLPYYGTLTKGKVLFYSETIELKIMPDGTTETESHNLLAEEQEAENSAYLEASPAQQQLIREVV